MKRKEKVSVITLGCSKNTVDSERLMRQIELNDIPMTGDPNKADTVIINTCGFIEAAKEESVNTILQAVALKNSGKLKKLIVAGCLSERYMNDLKNEIPEVDVYFGTEKYEEIIKELGGKFRYELLGERLLSTPSHTAYLKISEGCDHPCSFCAIPLMRGKHQSKPMESLIEETEYLASNGAKELILIAQDTTDYGKDIYGRKNLSELLNKLSEVKGIEWIRLMYAYPSHFPEDVIEVIADNPKILKYVDIPLQHISDDVLKSMRRGVTSRQTYNLLYKLRNRIPDITLRTTFIVGYPNETEKDFEQLVDFIKEIKFDRVGTFTFSVEENTSSFILGDPVPKEEKERRKKVLMEVQSQISLEKNATFLGKTLKVLSESKESEYYVGRSYRDAPEVDGEILFKSIGKLKPGNFYDVKITDYDEYDLYGEITFKQEN
ncbi:Ribosomal protein S12P methylthiotransferase [Ignavibacterium album JCM 16511]|uniref:Ribosomal protein uS12 methylthiotransferase RimO n=1 Tax=Ignavibacterium album (strain DSM 19864 / JCM 16511 / NBRC 101810 / Mat9-16) TaxID=945713 RepID=I0AH78_IGNAJ|nr:30S ribosomal protein S12 methylthiotransferase RimO [Ignavibacterium album]AFH48335.1 Ribosomal protein S12P methylthiotransferase [Ignavibacterium album JCM 16511]